ncbi:MAG: PH domain-containing protein [Patescibacteria group bacterium]|jgi:hypothetical protein
MSQSYLARQLRDGEELLTVVRRSPIAHLWGWVTGTLFIIAGFFFLYPLIHQGVWGRIVFAFLLVAGAVILVRTIILHRMNVFVLTSERVIDIDQRGMFSRVVSECLFQNIQEMSFSVTGVLGTVAHVGTLMVHTAGDRADLHISGIKDPQRVQELISKIQKHAAIQGSKEMSAAELVQIIDKIRSHVDLPVQKTNQINRTKNFHDPH